MMRVLVALVAVAVVVSSKPAQDDALSLSEEVDSYLSGVAKRSLDSRAVLCGPNKDTPCCALKTCPHGDCVDAQGPYDDNLAHYYGWVCEGSDCGTGPNQYTGINCDKPTENACVYCDQYHELLLCAKTRSTFEGVFCYGSEYQLLNSREVDFVFGQGTSEEITRIAKEHEKKRELSGLVERLLKELE